MPACGLASILWPLGIHATNRIQRWLDRQQAEYRPIWSSQYFWGVVRSGVEIPRNRLASGSVPSPALVLSALSNCNKQPGGFSAIRRPQGWRSCWEAQRAVWLRCDCRVHKKEDGRIQRWLDRLWPSTGPFGAHSTSG
jgi:hypothetical protein